MDLKPKERKKETKVVDGITQTKFEDDLQWVKEVKDGK